MRNIEDGISERDRRANFAARLICRCREVRYPHHKDRLQGDGHIDHMFTTGNDDSAMERWRHIVGMAFQLVDDWLDFASNSELLGKPSNADLK